MAKLKYYDSASSSWKQVDAANLNTVDGVHFRVYGGKLQYSADGSTWIDV